MAVSIFFKLIKPIFYILLFFSNLSYAIPLYWWEPDEGKSDIKNFGDTLSVVLVERIIGRKINKADVSIHPKVLGIGSILHFAKDNDIVWGSGINGKHLKKRDYSFNQLDVRAVRGPLTRSFLQKIGIVVPEIYGDPALLLPYFFSEFKRNPIREYSVIPHISENHLFITKKNVIFATQPWKEVVQKILESELVISSSLHGIIVAEAFGIPARLLRVTENEPLFKYTDYYLGTGRKSYQYASSIAEALQMGGEIAPIIDLEPLIKSFPIELFE